MRLALVEPEPRCLGCRCELTGPEDGDDLCFECADRAQVSCQWYAGALWLPCRACRSVQVPASEGVEECLECVELAEAV